MVGTADAGSVTYTQGSTGAVQDRTVTKLSCKSQYRSKTSVLQVMVLPMTRRRYRRRLIPQQRW
jgi:hypothetical protein